MGQTCLGTQTHSLCHDIAIPGLHLENFAHSYLICHSVSIKVGQGPLPSRVPLWTPVTGAGLPPDGEHM